MSEEPAAARLARYLDAWRAAPSVSELADVLPPLKSITALWAQSDFAAQTCLRDPGALAELQRDGLLDRAYAGGEMADELAWRLEGIDDEDALIAVLRLFRRREMLRIVWRDLGGLASLEETLEDLSELADVCVRQALDRLYDWLVAKSGVPRDSEGRPQHMIVLGMGKLGARELNLSSDIDLIFCFPSHGKTNGRRALENEQFFTRLGRQLIQVLSK